MLDTLIDPALILLDDAEVLELADHDGVFAVGVSEPGKTTFAYEHFDGCPSKTEKPKRGEDGEWIQPPCICGMPPRRGKWVLRNSVYVVYEFYSPALLCVGDSLSVTWTASPNR